MLKKISRDAWWVGGAVLLALALRLVNLSAQPFWLDEVVGLNIATTQPTAAATVAYVGDVEFHPPGYYLALRGWTTAFGETEAGARSLSVLFGLALVPLAYLLARELFGPGRGPVFAAWIVAVMPMQIDESQDARPYTIMATCAILALWGAWRHLRTGKRGPAALAAAVSAVGLYVHYSYVFLLVPLAAWWFLAAAADRTRRRELLMAWFLVHAAVFAAFLPWLDRMFGRLFLGAFPILDMMRQDYWNRPPAFFAETFQQLIWLTRARTLPRIEIIVEYAAVLALVVAAVAAVRKAPAARLSLRSPHVFLSWILLSTPVLFMLSPQSKLFPHVVSERHILQITVMAAILIADVLGRLSSKASAVVLATLLISFIPRIADVVGNDALWDPLHALRPAAEFVNAEAKPGDIVIASDGMFRAALGRYLNPDIPSLALFPARVTDGGPWAGRQVPGMLELETVSRKTENGAEAVTVKLGAIDREHAPKRVWLHSIYGIDSATEWYEARGWRHAVHSKNDPYWLDLYVRP